MNESRELLDLTVPELLARYPFLDSFLVSYRLTDPDAAAVTLRQRLDSLDEEEMEDRALDPHRLLQDMTEYIRQMNEFLGEEESLVESVTILPGTDKNGRSETFGRLDIRRGEIVCIVGPTGSGKSRLLGDIEWVAQQDTPTGRRILINDETPETKWRFSAADKLVAQLSQNMNFVMDLTVREFLELHAESRLVADLEAVIERIITEANRLAGEKFTPDTPVTSLSGGQSRALMIADTAILSRSPIILIDEIENAGIDRKQALALLLAEEKIVLMATHDPVLALMGHRRIVIRNGGIHKVIETTAEERTILAELEEMDRRLQSLRTRLRHGDILTSQRSESCITAATEPSPTDSRSSANCG